MSYQCGLHPRQRESGSKCRRADCAGCNAPGLAAAQQKAVVTATATETRLVSAQDPNLYDEIVAARNMRRDWVLETAQKCLVAGGEMNQLLPEIIALYDEILHRLEPALSSNPTDADPGIF